MFLWPFQLCWVAKVNAVSGGIWALGINIRWSTDYSTIKRSKLVPEVTILFW